MGLKITGSVGESVPAKLVLATTIISTAYNAFAFSGTRFLWSFIAAQDFQKNYMDHFKLISFFKKNAFRLSEMVGPIVKV